MTTTRPKFGWKLRALLTVQPWLTRLGLLPDADAYCRWPEAKRKAMKPAPWMTYPTPASVLTRREVIDTADGNLEVKLFARTGQPAPTILFMHGGGWVLGGADSLDYLCANLCDRLDTGVASVDYRLAPDHPFPAGLEDCYSALTWMAARTTQPIAVVGDSAGGNLAAALCLLARDRGGPDIAHQTLIYPALDAALESPSMALQHTGMSRSDAEKIVRHYIGDRDPRNGLVSPIHASNHRGLPPAFIVTADHDLLRDDGSRYAKCLEAAGVAVRYVNYPDMPHGFLSQPKLCPGAPGALADIVEEMRRHLRPADGRLR